MQACPQMAAIITAIATKHNVDLAQVGANFRLDMPGYDRLCVERISPGCLSVAHYFEMSGDLVAEPDIVFLVDAMRGWIPISISQSIIGWRKYAVLNDAGTSISRYNPQAQRNLAEFAEMWARNIAAQGWLDEGVRYVCANGG